MKMTLSELRSYVAKELKQDFYTNPKEHITKLPTGFYQLDYYLGGGLREGSFVELFGPPASGKTYMMHQIMKQAQQAYPDKYVLYLDHEYAFDPERAENLGVDVDRVLYAQPETMEDGFNGILSVLDSDEELSLIVIDSISAMLPREEEKKDVGERSMALQALLNTQVMKKLPAKLNRNKTTLLVTNQVRDNMSTYGTAHKTSGGNALKHHANTRLAFTRVKESSPDKIPDLDGGYDEKVEKYFTMKISLDKHRGKWEHRTASLRYVFEEEGVDKMHDLTNYLKRMGMVSGTTWISISGVEKKVQGRNGLIKYLEENPAEIDRLVKEANDN